MRTSLLLVAVCCGLLTTFLSPVAAQTSKPTQAKPSPKSDSRSGPRDVRSKNFLLHTDLDEAEAAELLVRLETMLKLISTYWAQPNRQIIECYIVKDLEKWPPGVIDPRGMQSLQDRAGVTLTTVSLVNGKPTAAKAKVYATADRGCPLHEAVHAYCGQVFGRTGPLWYSEGMAEMGAYWKENDPSVNCPPEAVKFIRSSEPKSLNAIVNAKEFTGDSWENYQWRWALCHLLANNPNYATRFRPLGFAMLNDHKNVSFESVYGDMAEEISFEYLFFLKHFDVGYRADLCGWDWKAKFKPPTNAIPLTSKIKARGGWQPTLCRVKADTEYEFVTEGKWRFQKSGPDVDANGAEDGRGKLVGAVFDPDNYELSDPFELGVTGDWTSKSDGHLVVRCQQPWNEINDEDSGNITLKISAKRK